MPANGILCATIDDYQQKELHFLLEQEFGQSCHAGTVSIRNNPSGRPVPSGFAQSHEYAIFMKNTQSATIGKISRSEKQEARYRHVDEDGNFMWELFRKRGSGSEHKDRPSLYYPLYVHGEKVRVPKMVWDSVGRIWNVLEEPQPNEIVVYPVDEQGVERRWRGKPDNAALRPSNFKAKIEDDAATIYYKFRPKSDGVLPLTTWMDAKYSATEHGTGILKHYFMAYNIFSYPKSVYAVEDCLAVCNLSRGNGVVCDYFAGSGTTGHAVISLNRKDGGQRKYILVEMGDYFETVLKPRIAKVVYSERWKDGRPQNVERPADKDQHSLLECSQSAYDPYNDISHCFKYLRLESYEDSLNNLELRRSDEQQRTLFDNESKTDALQEYMLSYMINVETSGSPSLLNIDAFENPFAYKFKVQRGDETRIVNVDLVETFNYLIGLTVRHIDMIRGIKVVQGINPGGERVLILWRKVKEMDNDASDGWFGKQGYNTRDMEFDLVYVNGDNNLENLRKPDHTWKVRLIEEEFQCLMFDVEDV